VNEGQDLKTLRVAFFLTIEGVDEHASVNRVAGICFTATAWQPVHLVFST
jgi:hypothetical protein